MVSQSSPSVDVLKLRQEIKVKYREVAAQPEHEFHFHHGRPLAKLLGYPGEMVDNLPDSVVESFAGTGNPFSLGHRALLSEPPNRWLVSLDNKLTDWVPGSRSKTVLPQKSF